jgi:hypothetical protein
MVEGKVSESFGPTLDEWRGAASRYSEDREGGPVVNGSSEEYLAVTAESGPHHFHQGFSSATHLDYGSRNAVP